MPDRRPLGRALGKIARGLTILGAMALVVMMASTVVDVIMRGVANKPLRGVVDLVEITMLLCAFLGLPEVLLRGEQVVVDLVDNFVPKSVLRILKLASLLLTMAAVWLIGLNVIRPMMDAYRFGDVKFELNVPLYPLFAVVLVCLTASLVTTAYSALQIWRENENRSTP